MIVMLCSDLNVKISKQTVRHERRIGSHHTTSSGTFSVGRQGQPGWKAI